MPDKGVSLEQLMSAYGPQPLRPSTPLPKPPPSRSSHAGNGNLMQIGNLNVRGRAGSNEMMYARQRSNTSSSSLSPNSSTASRRYQLEALQLYQRHQFLLLERYRIYSAR